jgi:uncharacterized SAM-binding protein YcdF (DUF218 family)
MFYIFSKLLYFLLYPVTWLYALFFWQWKTKNANRKKLLLKIMVVIFFVFGNEVLQNKIERWWQVNNSEIQTNKQYSAAVLLGGMAGFDVQDKGYFLGNADRFIQVVQLFHLNKIKKVIVSGGSGKLLSKEPAEANFIVEQLKNSGVPDTCILMENKSRNTFENALFTKRIADSLHLALPFVLVSSANHLPRAKLVFNKAGMNVVLHPSSFESINKKFAWEDYFLPNLHALDRWRFLFKEFVGVLVYKITGKA